MIVWARRVPQRKIRLLYENDAAGIVDVDLIDDVGCSLLARCESFIDAVEASRGRAKCFGCGGKILHGCRPDELLRCPHCGWESPWRDYFKTIQHKQLSGAEPVLALFGAFARRFPTAAAPREKLLLIDELIHGFHIYFRNEEPTRPTAVNLIEGSMMEVIAFLDRLTCGETTAPEIKQRHEAWRRTMESTLRRWGREMP